MIVIIVSDPSREGFTYPEKGGIQNINSHHAEVRRFQSKNSSTAKYKEHQRPLIRHSRIRPPGMC